MVLQSYLHLMHAMMARNNPFLLVVFKETAKTLVQIISCGIYKSRVLSFICLDINSKGEHTKAIFSRVAFFSICQFDGAIKMTAI